MSAEQTKDLERQVRERVAADPEAAWRKIYPGPLRRQGDFLVGNCPFCGDKNCLYIHAPEHIGDLNRAISQTARNQLAQVIAAPQPGRNDPCPCGSGKKYKRCCLNTGDDEL